MKYSDRGNCGISRNWKHTEEHHFHWMKNIARGIVRQLYLSEARKATTATTGLDENDLGSGVCEERSCVLGARSFLGNCLQEEVQV